MRYYAYENWRANGHLVKIHVSECSFCNTGRGLAGGTRPDNGQWLDLGECRGKERAKQKARDLIKARDSQFCRHCC